MTWTALTAGETDSDSPLDQALFDKIRTNDADHESRILILEDPNVRVFSHFARRQGYGGTTTDDIIVSATNSSAIEEFFTEPFMLGANGGVGATGSVTNGALSGTNDNHYLRLACTGGSGAAFVACQLAVNFANRTSPLTFTTRFRQSDNTNLIRIGLMAWGTAPFTDFQMGSAAGIWLNLNGTNWRFSSQVPGSTTHGSDFTRVAANTWTEVQIIFESSPSNRARCFSDSVLKETLSADLPTTYTLYGVVYTPLGSGDTLDVDRMEVSAGGVISDL